jgi:putative tricarboxylic transport membrane protein
LGIAILALTLPFEHIFVRGGRGRLDEEREERVRPITLLTAGLLVVVVLSVELLGLALATVIVCAALPLLWGERRAKVLIPFAILFPTAVALLFSYVLKIYFEPGLLGFTIG